MHVRAQPRRKKGTWNATQWTFFLDQRVEIRDSDNKIQGMISRKENSEQTTKKRSEIRENQNQKAVRSNKKNQNQKTEIRSKRQKKEQCLTLELLELELLELLANRVHINYSI